MEEVGSDAIQVQGPAEIHVQQASPDGQAVGEAYQEHQAPAKAEVDTTYNTPDPVWPGMPRNKFKIYGEYLRETADRLGLRDWAFNLKWEPYQDSPGDTNTFAAVQCIEGRKSATVMLCKDFASASKGEQKQALIHELIHCHFDPIDRVLWTASSHMSSGAMQILGSNHHNAIEIAVDALACELACLLPDIPEG